MVAYDTKLWTHVSLRPEISGLHVGTSISTLRTLILIKLGLAILQFIFLFFQTLINYKKNNFLRNFGKLF